MSRMASDSHGLQARAPTRTKGPQQQLRSWRRSLRTRRSALEPPRATPPQQPEDPVTRLFGKLFGQRALEDPEPFGLKRLADDAPELYPATTDRWAAPLAGDDALAALVRPLLADTQLEAVSLRLAYDAERNGWSGAAFHAAVDGFGAALVLAQTARGAVCGGYNPRGWIGLGEDRDAIAAFLFTWPDGNTEQRPVKLPKVGGPSLAVMGDRSGGGIIFGADGLAIPLAAGNERFAKCRLGTYYARMPDGGRSLFAADEAAKGAELVALQVLVAEGEGESWELDGLTWKTKTGQ